MSCKPIADSTATNVSVDINQKKATIDFKRTSKSDNQINENVTVDLESLEVTVEEIIQKGLNSL